ncbi:MAG: flavin oxidoreductase/NADH oxidase [Provencibacterium sp.]|jgi:2,4-dienoyl-CoA reductase-like NADH-dependent reductase (Old Yellow Enzyme family)|nr:flavin oxidoreductase/NADH oxidase [Provencibacterium sp.]
MPHVKFHYPTPDALRQELDGLGLQLPLSEDTSILSRPVSFAGRTLPNRLAIQPMEGCDGTAEGAPDTLTLRRYDRFARSGAALIWAEATAVAEEGRANPRQLFLTEKTLPAFQRMVEDIRETCQKENGFNPLIILQATHSGRYSKPHGVPEPVIAYNSPVFEKDSPIPKDRIVSDDRLRRLEEEYGQTAALAVRAGFDGVDVKACHRYLCCELLSAYTREGDYGGSFENRTRLLRNGVKAARAAVPSSFIVTTRLNVYDGFPYPYGFGMAEDGSLTPDLREPLALVEILHRQLGMPLIDITIGNPYVNPHVNRPYDEGGYLPEEHPLEGVCRMADCVGTIQRAYPDLTVISSGVSYLRQYAGMLAAGEIETGVCQIAGFGREAFAYPSFARDLLRGEGMDPKKCCIACGKCTELMRAGSKAGCVVRDSETYLPLYRQDVLKK